MRTIVDEINAAVKTLGLPDGAMRQLPPDESEKVHLAALNHFVRSGDPWWWWEDFREQGTSVMFDAGDGWRHIADIAPNPDALVWFIAEETELPHYPVFETTPRIASEIIGECYAFEYYMVAQNFEWLVCETHHNCVCAVGAQVEQRLKRYSAQQDG
jgi:Family of unknown function (DUF6756)